MSKGKRRPFTEDEIEDILTSIFPQTNNTVEPIQQALNNSIDKLKKSLLGATITPKNIPKLKKIIKQRWEESRVQPGTPVGVICSLYLSELLTQNVLNTFHFAGIGGATVHQTTMGLPQIKKLLHASKNNNPSSFIYIKKSKLKGCITKKEKLRLLFKISSKLNMCYISDLINKGTIKYGVKKDNWWNKWYQDYSVDWRLPNKGDEGWWTVTLPLNADALFKYQVEPYQVRETIDNLRFAGVFCMESYPYSEEVPGNITILISTEYFEDTTKIRKISETEKAYSKEKGWSISEHISRISKEYLGMWTNDTIDYDYKIVGNDIEYQLTYIRINILDIILNPNSRNPEFGLVSGVVNISEASPVIAPDEEFFIVAKGSNLPGLFDHPMVDSRRTICDDINEIQKVLGMEALRKFYINKIQAIAGFGNINPAHYTLLIDEMTSMPKLRAMNRYGMTKDRSSPFGQLAFEQVKTNLINNSLYSSIEYLRGISASVLMGQPPKVGTEGPFKITLKTPKKPISLHRNGKMEEVEVHIHEGSMVSLDDI